MYGGLQSEKFACTSELLASCKSAAAVDVQLRMSAMNTVKPRIAIMDQMLRVVTKGKEWRLRGIEWSGCVVVMIAEGRRWREREGEKRQGMGTRVG
jgi:hypothetical protein